CDIDTTRSCRAPGDTCTSGPGSTCCYGCDPITKRCQVDPGQCRETGAPCEIDANCCKGKCVGPDAGPRTCQTMCLTGDAPCGQNAECCRFNCAGSPSTCGAIVASPGADGGTVKCAPTGSRCTSPEHCCSHFCSGGFCDLPCRLTGVACAA